MAGGRKTCRVPRRTWLDDEIDVFLEDLAASSMHLERQRAGELITGQVRAVATLRRVTEATARTYLDEIITDMAPADAIEVRPEYGRKGPRSPRSPSLTWVPVTIEPGAPPRQ